MRTAPSVLVASSTPASVPVDMASLVSSAQLAGGGEVLGDGSQSQVVVVADLDEHPKCLVVSDLVPFHQDALGLPDQVSGRQRRTHVVHVLDAGERDRGVAGEQQSYLLRLVIEGIHAPAVQVQRTQVVTLDP